MNQCCGAGAAGAATFRAAPESAPESAPGPWPSGAGASQKSGGSATLNNTVLVLGIGERTEGTEKLLHVEGRGGGRFYCHKRARAADVQRRTRQVSSVCQNYSDLVLVLIKQFRERLN